MPSFCFGKLSKQTILIEHWDTLKQPKKDFFLALIAENEKKKRRKLSECEKKFFFCLFVWKKQQILNFKQFEKIGFIKRFNFTTFTCFFKNAVYLSLFFVLPLFLKQLSLFISTIPSDHYTLELSAKKQKKKVSTEK